MNRYSSLSDDYYLNMNLTSEMELDCSRETILHFFEQLNKKYPAMRNFFQRGKCDFVLEEDKQAGQYRWCSIEPRRVGSWQFNPESLDSALEQHRFVLDLVPFALSLRPLDCESLDFTIGFDFSYRGNHNTLIAEALGVNPALEPLIAMPGSRILGNDPVLTLALDEDCRKQCRVAVESRTSAYHVRTGEYPEEMLSVYVSAGMYGGLGPDADYAEVLEELSDICCDVIDSYVAEQVLSPLARTISLE
jgi:hypothetical protein